MRIYKNLKFISAVVLFPIFALLTGCGGSSGGAATTSSLTQMGGGKQGGPLSLTATVSTLAGSALVSGFTDGTGATARFNRPYNITTDGANLYITDTVNNTIRKVVISTGVVTTLAGAAGVSGHADGIGAAATFNFPNGITTDGTNVFVSETSNNTIRKIVISTGAVATLAGTAGVSGHADGTGSAATFNGPSGITTDGTNLYVSEGTNSLIRQIAISSGVVTTLAGTAGVWGSWHSVKPLTA